MTERQIEMRWCCAICSHIVLGRDLNCAHCGKPREGEEDLPIDAYSAPTVTDPELLRKATAGPNWSCHYCRSSQRRLDGACARCGAPAADAEPRGRPLSQARREYTERRAKADAQAVAEFAETLRRGWHSGALIIAASALALALLAWWLFVPRAVTARVSAVSWRQAVAIERYSIIKEDGWHHATDALATTNEGPRVHHYDHRLVGSHFEHYTVQVACGQTCSPIPRSCSESCSSNKNGFATCRTSCTGGGQSCSTRYCSEGRTRSVNDYQDFPIFQDYYSWTAWRWHHQRDVVLAGSTTETRWPGPEQEEHLGESLGPGEQEREGARSASYSVTFGAASGAWRVASKSEKEFQAHALGSWWTIEVDRVGIVHAERPLR